MPDGQYDLGGQAVFVKNGEARLADGVIAGSTLVLHRAIHNMITLAKMPPETVIPMADEHPGGFRRREGLRPHRAGGLRRADADGRGMESGGRDGIKREEQRACKLRSMRRRKSAAARGLTMCSCWRGWARR